MACRDLENKYFCNILARSVRNYRSFSKRVIMKHTVLFPLEDDDLSGMITSGVVNRFIHMFEEYEKLFLFIFFQNFEHFESNNEKQIYLQYSVSLRYVHFPQLCQD